MFLNNLGNFFKKAADGISHIAVSAFNGFLQPVGVFLIHTVVPTALTWVAANPQTILSPGGLAVGGAFVLSTIFAGATASQNKDVALAAQAGKALYDAHILAVKNAPAQSAAAATLPVPPPVVASSLPIVANK